MKRIAVLGSTGSIGRNTLDIAAAFPGKFEVVGLSAHSNVDVLCRQIKKFRPQWVCVNDPRAMTQLAAQPYARACRLLNGKDELAGVLKERGIDIVVMAISGAEALIPLLAAIESGKDVALANKEALVMAGEIVMAQARDRRANIIPIDSEQSAIWQCLHGEDQRKIQCVYLTASGGPLYKRQKKSFAHIGPQEVLKHPRWKMGKKITVDSATLMNKGLEVIEAMHLFSLSLKSIKVIIHPEAIIHSMVGFMDGVVMAQLSVTDMRIPIQYALSYPERLMNTLPRIDFHRLGKLHFADPDFRKFPCLDLAFHAARAAGTVPSVLNAANEVCVEEFLHRRLRFIDIAKVVEKVMGRHRTIRQPLLNDILSADAWARQEASRAITRTQ